MFFALRKSWSGQNHPAKSGKAKQNLSDLTGCDGPATSLKAADLITESVFRIFYWPTYDASYGQTVLLSTVLRGETYKLVISMHEVGYAKKVKLSISMVPLIQPKLYTIEGLVGKGGTAYVVEMGQYRL